MLTPFIFRNYQHNYRLKIKSLMIAIGSIKAYKHEPNISLVAGWSSPVARQAHNLKVIGSNPIPATKGTNLYRVFARGRLAQR